MNKDMKKTESKNKIDYREHEEPPRDKLPGTSDVASAHECTGLIPGKPQNDAEERSYNELYSMEIPKKENK